MSRHDVLRSPNTGLKRSLGDDAKGSAGEPRRRGSVVVDDGGGPSAMKRKGAGCCWVGSASVARSESGRCGGVSPREEDAATTLRSLQAGDEPAWELQERHGNGETEPRLRQREPVLIVEDGQEMADCCKQSYDVCGARTDIDALRIVGTRQVGAVVLDTDM